MASSLSEVDDEKLDAMIRQTQAAVETVASGLSKQPWTPELIQFLTVSLLLFGVAVIGLMAALLHRGRNATDILRLFTLPMVITSAVILVVLGFSNAQMTPVIGLLGTMVGYILGATRAPSDVLADSPDGSRSAVPGTGQIPVSPSPAAPEKPVVPN